MDPFEITTPEGKMLVGMVQKLVNGREFLRGFEKKFEIIRDSLESRIEDDAFAFTSDVLTILALYEPDKAIYQGEKDQGLLDEEGALKELRELLDRVEMD